ncbi:MAG: hypothetical protein AAFZ18_11215 [Myxococcota bacterium]
MLTSEGAYRRRWCLWALCGLAVGQSACFGTSPPRMIHVHSGEDLRSMQSVEAAAGLASVGIERFLGYRRKLGDGYQSLDIDDDRYLHGLRSDEVRDLSLELADQLAERGISVSEELPERIAVRGYVAPVVFVQRGRSGVWLPSSSSDSIRVITLVLRFRESTGHTWWMRAPVLVQQSSRLEADFAQSMSLAVDLAAGLIIRELERLETL